MSHTNQIWIMHVDMDAFFAAVEQRDNPDYRNRPVVVGARPGGRGVVATCSYEARRFGVHSAMPISEAWRRCPGAVYLRPDMRRYAAVSRQIMQMLGEISPLVEPVSIDEAYLDVSGQERLIGPPQEIARQAKARILEAVSLSCSVGVGPNRLIAKLASESGKPDGLTVVGPGQVEAFLDPLPVSELRGVGRRTGRILDRLGIAKVRQLRGYPLQMLIQHLGEKAGRSLYAQARGMASHRVGVRSARKSISKETTFAEDVRQQSLLRSRLQRLSAEVGRLARYKGLSGQVVTLKLRLAGFETHTRQRRLVSPVDTDDLIFATAWQLYQESQLVGRPVRLIGVGLSDFEHGPQSEDLFESTPERQMVRQRRKQVFKTLDEVAAKFDSTLLTRGFYGKGK